MNQEQESSDEIRDIKTARSNLEILPIAVIFFVPSTIWFSHNLIIYFLFGAVHISITPWNIYFEVQYIIPYLLTLFTPALLVSVMLSLMLKRLSAKKTTTTRVLQTAVGATIVWVMYFSLYFFSELTFGRLSLGPIPIPIGPIVAVLIRNSILKMTEQIDSFESSQQKTSVQT